jgi:NAD(P)-dependent dehydrogenase (short-subunit alcohol dehydrogenase family)
LKKLANDLSSYHITVNAVAPGIFPSKMSNQLLTYVSKDDLQSTVPLGRVGKLEDAAGVAIYLSSKASSWVTGITIPVHGGGSKL